MNFLEKNLDKKVVDSIIHIITSYKKVEKIVLFGSRVKGTHTGVSDIDIAVFSKEWNSTDINLVKDHLDDELKTPFKIDLINFYQLTKSNLRENILKEGISIYERGEN